MGGSLSLIAAEHAKVDAAVSFYGTPSSKKELSHVRPPLKTLPPLMPCALFQQQPFPQVGALKHVEAHMMFGCGRHALAEAGAGVYCMQDTVDV